MALKFKKGDRVIVSSGRDKGRSGVILKMMPAKDRAIVQGVNMIKRHQKQTQTEEGGIISREAPVHLSNLMHEDPADGKPTRVGFKILEDGRKVRFAKRSGEMIDG